MGKLYTIGHSVHQVETFIGFLKTYGIDYILDVRSVPYSKFTKQFNKESIEKELFPSGISYFHMGEYFGARPSDKSLYNKSGYLDFEKVKKSAAFNKGVDNVLLGLDRGHVICLMCTEKDPIDCHRAILIARAFEERNIPVEHILSDGSLQTQEVLNERLIARYFPDAGQMSLFPDKSPTNSDVLIKLSYEQRNADIGYRPFSI